MALVLLVPLAALRPVAKAQEAPAPRAGVLAYADDAAARAAAEADLEADLAFEVEAEIEAEIDAIQAEIDAAAAEVDAALAEVGAARAEVEAHDPVDLPEVLVQIERAEGDLSSHRAVIEAWRRKSAALSQAEWRQTLRDVEASVSNAEACTEDALATLKRSRLGEETWSSLREAIDGAQQEAGAARLVVVDSEAQTRAALSVSTIAIRAIERDAQRTAAEARRDALRRLGKPTARPGVQAAPRPPARRFRAEVRRTDGQRADAPFDWDAVDQAREAALHDAHS